MIKNVNDAVRSQRMVIDKNQKRACRNTTPRTAHTHTTLRRWIAYTAVGSRRTKRMGIGDWARWESANCKDLPEAHERRRGSR